MQIICIFSLDNYIFCKNVRTPHSAAGGGCGVVFLWGWSKKTYRFLRMSKIICTFAADL